MLSAFALYVLTKVESLSSFFHHQPHEWDSTEVSSRTLLEACWAMAILLHASPPHLPSPDATSRAASPRSHGEVPVSANVYAVASPPPLLCATPIFPSRRHDNIRWALHCVASPQAQERAEKLEKLAALQRKMREAHERSEKLEDELRAWAAKAQLQLEHELVAIYMEQHGDFDDFVRQVVSVEAASEAADKPVIADQGDLSGLKPANRRSELSEELENELAAHQLHMSSSCTSEPLSRGSTIISQQRGKDEDADRGYACERSCGYAQVEAHGLECRETKHSRKMKSTATFTLARGPNGKLGMTFGNAQPGPYTVVALRSQGAACRSGLLHEGDLIHSIDNQSVYHLDPEQVSGLLCGPPGSAVCLEISSATGVVRTDKLSSPELRQERETAISREEAILDRIKEEQEEAAARAVQGSSTQRDALEDELDRIKEEQEAAARAAGRALQAEQHTEQAGRGTDVRPGIRLTKAARFGFQSRAADELR